MKVLVLKAPNESSQAVDPYVHALRSANIRAEGLEVLSFQYQNLDILQKKISNPDGFGGLVFTSPRGVKAVSKCLEGQTLGKSSWSNLPSYVVGEGTARVVWETLGLKSIGQESGSARQLADFICKDLSNCQNGSIKPLLFPSADLRHNLLLETLSKADLRIDVVTSYKTIPHPQLKELLVEKFTCKISRPDALVFFSPSGVSAVLPHLLDIGVCPESLKMIVIGQTTETALKEQGLPVFATAVNPSPSGLVQAITISQSLNVES